jgi:hypothetical protein
MVNNRAVRLQLIIAAAGFSVWLAVKIWQAHS